MFLKKIILLLKKIKQRLLIRMTDEEKNKFFHDFIFWQQEGLDIERQQCLFINFGVNMKFEYSQLRRVITMFGKIYKSTRL